MKPEALLALVEMTLKREGYLDYFYADAKGLITIGKGFLAEYTIPGTLEFTCAPDVVRASWRAVKAEYQREQEREARGEPTKTAWRNGGAHYGDVPGNIARATEESIERTFVAHVGADEATLRGLFAEWDAWPWQSQLATASFAYAAGAHLNLKWPRFCAACRARNWAVAAIECVPSPAEMAKQNDSFHKRVAEQVRLFKEAAAIGGTVYVEPAEAPMVKPKNGTTIA